MRLKIFFTALIAISSLAASANAGVILDIVVDPAVTAFTGIPASGGFSGSSTRSGVGTWHLYALDDDDFGLNNYKITMNGAVLINHRSPTTNWSDVDENLDPISGSAGFSDAAIRSATNANPVVGGQIIGSASRIAGLGTEASNFAAELPPTHSFSGTLNGQWGNYATDSLLPTPDGRRWVFLAEGTYNVGTAPTINLQGTSTNVVVFTANDFSTSAFADVCVGAVQCLGPSGVAPDVGDLDEGLVPRNGVNNLGPLPILNSPVPPAVTWELVSFTGSGEPSDAAAFVNPATGEFSWDTNGNTSVGPYSAVIRASNTSGSDEGTLSFEIFVPEPASCALFGIAMVGCFGLIRRRNG